MLDILKLVSSDDIGQDESNVQTLLKKHKVNLTIYLSIYIFTAKYILSILGSMYTCITSVFHDVTDELNN